MKQHSQDKRNILLTVAYNGAHFSGWQRQTEGQRTVQGSIEAALSGLFAEAVNVVGAGRTDAGVHADGQAVNFWLTDQRPLEELAPLIASSFPEDIVCLAAREALPSFNARYRAVRKTYAYTLHDGPVADRHPGKRAYHVASRLDEMAMGEAASLFTGIRNFKAFTTAKQDARAFLRELFSVDCVRRGNLLEMRFTADGFLYKQVRFMAAAMAAVGLGRSRPDLITTLLETQDRSKAAAPLAAYGLRLIRVDYSEEDFLGPTLSIG